MKILSVEIFSEGGPEKAFESITSDLSGTTKLVSATGAHGLVTAKRDPNFKKILDAFHINLPDGMPGVWVGRLKGANKMRRCYGPDFFMESMIGSSNKNITHFLCGGKNGVAEKLRSVCEEKFNANVVGTYCPPFLPIDSYNYKEIGAMIDHSNASIVWIGLSTPKQEEFAFLLAKYTKAACICCVGAAFDFHIGNVIQAPKWIQKMGLEWFFRLSVEPRRLWKRYFEIVPLFIYYIFVEIFTGRFYKDI